MAQVALEQENGVLIRTLGGRKLLFGTGDEWLGPIQRRQLVLFVGRCIVVFSVFSGKGGEKGEISYRPNWLHNGVKGGGVE